MVAATWVDSSDNHVYVALSDGRGRPWEAPIRVDQDTSGAFKQVRQQSCRVLFDDQSGGNKDWIYVVWEDTRNDDVNTSLVETDLYLAGSNTTAAPGTSSWSTRTIRPAPGRWRSGPSRPSPSPWATTCGSC